MEENAKLEVSKIQDKVNFFFNIWISEVPFWILSRNSHWPRLKTSALGSFLNYWSGGSVANKPDNLS